MSTILQFANRTARKNDGVATDKLADDDFAW